MVRSEQGIATRGSQRWLQLGVNRRPETLNNAIGRALGFSPDEQIQWRSPLETDGFAEYCDNDFLSLLGLDLERRPLDDFWPRRGPVWDGLSVTNRGRIILVEAKANIPEFNSSPTGAGERSLGKIRQSLDEVREFLKARSGADWTQCFYQYANRLAHLYLLRELNGIDAKLAFVYFVNDRSNPPREPVSRDGWEVAIHLANEHLSIPHSQRWITENVADVFIDVAEYEGVSWVDYRLSIHQNTE